MGKHNRQRRAAKKRRKKPSAGRSQVPPQGRTQADRSGQARRTPPPRAGTSSQQPPPPPPPQPEELVWAAVSSWATDRGCHEAALDALVGQFEAAMMAANTLLDEAVDQLWGRGWAPTDLVHVVARELTPRHDDVAAEQVLADGRRRVKDGQVLHPSWHEQLASIGEREPAAALPLLGDRLRLVVEVLCVVARLGEIPRTVPAPGDPVTGSASRATHLDARMLGRVRALLAQAESTTFEEEAEAFTAKAQELIARHAIDEAMLHTVDDVGDPSVRRILVDDPYADAKACLFAEVAGANRCRTVYSTNLGWVTAFGYEHDLDALELLTTSLLAQATSAMVRHGSRRDAAGRSRTRSFRRAFLLGFGRRIGERLRRATDGQVSSTDAAAGRFLPVLAARVDRLRAAERTAFPEVVQRAATASNATGWSAGRAAAEFATLEVSPHRVDSFSSDS